MTQPELPAPPTSPGAIRRTLGLWFSLEKRVTRRAYLVTGLCLMAAKYVIEGGLIFAATGKVWPIYAFFSPIYAIRAEILSPAPDWLTLVLGLTTLPFLWIGVSMSVRRAVTAGMSAWVGILFLVPIANYFLMVILAALPDRRPAAWSPAPLGPYRRGKMEGPPSGVEIDHPLKSALLGVLCAVGFGLSMLAFSVYALDIYGFALFFVTPFVMGAMSAYIYNRPTIQPLGATMGVALVSVILTGSAILLFALEGLVCLLMAFPIAGVVVLLGAVAGRAIAMQGPRALTTGSLALLAAAPGAAGVEAASEPPLYEVATTIEVAAPPEVVWNHVIGFSELDPPSEWVFATGIAYPMRATIQGAGVGAVRHCEFSTGPFVEPITVWDAPQRLAFDVAAQPPSMREWSPFQGVAPPHLESAILSKRGEFRLIALENGHTRLEGSTWYTLSMYPSLYWKNLSDSLLHMIHSRVLRHVKALSEADQTR